MVAGGAWRQLGHQRRLAVLPVATGSSNGIAGQGKQGDGRSGWVALMVCSGGNGDGRWC